MAAANSNDRESESSSKGRAMDLQDGFSSPRNARARLMRDALRTNWGSAEVAMTVATPNS